MSALARRDERATAVATRSAPPTRPMDGAGRLSGWGSADGLPTTSPPGSVGNGPRPASNGSSRRPQVVWVIGSHCSKRVMPPKLPVHTDPSGPTWVAA